MEIIIHWIQTNNSLCNTVESYIKILFTINVINTPIYCEQKKSFYNSDEALNVDEKWDICSLN